MSDPHAWDFLTPAQQLAVITAMTRDDQTDNRERIAYDGHEPAPEYLTGDESDRRADLEQARAERQWGAA